MVTNEAGQVALIYYQTIPHVLSVHSHEYAFAVRARICLAWIAPTDVDAVLSKTKKCCGNNERRVYRFATQQQVNIWSNGGGSGR